MHIIGKLNLEIYRCVSADIVSDEIIITDKQIAHIKERHPNDYELIAPFMNLAISQPDFLLKDKRHKNTGLILKHISENNIRFQLVLRVHTPTDPQGFSNSILSAWIVSAERWNRYLKNEIILYKHE